MTTDRRRWSVAAAPLLILAAALPAPGPVAAADPVDFGRPSASSAYGESLRFVQPVELPAPADRVEILLETPGAAGPSVVEVEPPGGSGARELAFEMELEDGHIVPNTTFTARWRITDADGVVSVGPEVTHVYADDRVDWRTVEGDIVRVHWYEGGDGFGERALQIGERAVEETAALLGVTETEPIDFYVYADQETFYGALGPGTRENVGGQAHSDIRTLFALITPGEIDAGWVEVVIPHELVHLVFATAIDNPYHAPPHWLNEGLAVYLSEGYGASDRNAVETVARDGSIIPLEGLVGAFPTTRDRFFLAYAESVSAVDHIVATFGRDALVRLIRSYQTGVTDDEAFEAALGVDMAGFEADWLRSVGASAPVRHGPQPAPPGPVPDGWSGAAPVPSVEPGRSPAGATSAPTSPVPGVAADASPLVPILVGGLLLAVLVAFGLVPLRRRNATGAAPPASAAAGGWTAPPRSWDRGATDADARPNRGPIDDGAPDGSPTDGVPPADQPRP
ncbi:MAG TPA: peptidase MA family metallohydrolase [Candidatus Limnocylindrales bacterium]|nr:peptidase MA family metallohydrolase [Candidatus Limnocylindrales bacterium]